MTSFNSRTVALMFGVTFILVGILGFIPNPLVSPTGIFEVNVHHNIVHLLTGLLILSGPALMKGKEHLMLIVAGVLYGLVALLGFIQGPGLPLGMIAVNDADNFLHVALAAILIGAGLLAPRQIPVNRMH